MAIVILTTYLSTPTRIGDTCATCSCYNLEILLRLCLAAVRKPGTTNGFFNSVVADQLLLQFICFFFPLSDGGIEPP